MQFSKTHMAKRPATPLSPMKGHAHLSVLKSVLVRIELPEKLMSHSRLNRILAETE
jgi:hypothetical protein